MRQPEENQQKDYRFLKSRSHGDHEERPAHLAHDESNWLVSYADMMTLLFGFFVLMYSLSKIDHAKFEVVRKDLVKFFGGKMVEQPAVTNLYRDLVGVISANEALKGVEVVKALEGITLKFDSALLFNSGSAQLKPEMLPHLTKITQMIRANKNVEYVKVEGHTDDEPIESVVFPSNWELSAARATRVVRQFEAAGIPPERLTAEGYGSSRPVAPNRDEKGVPIPENLAKNRRVIVKVGFGFDQEAAVAALESKELTLPDGDSVNQGPMKEIPDLVKAKTPEESVQERLVQATARLEEAQAKLKTVMELEKKRKELEAAEKKVQAIEAKIREIEERTRAIYSGSSIQGPRPASLGGQIDEAAPAARPVPGPSTRPPATAPNQAPAPRKAPTSRSPSAPRKPSGSQSQNRRGGSVPRSAQASAGAPVGAASLPKVLPPKRGETQ